jgi:threonine dehydratase
MRRKPVSPPKTATPARQVAFADVEAAHRRISGFLQPTPLARSAYFSAAWDNNVFFKFENRQPTGSFKDRGALNKMLCLHENERALGVIAASAGNHGRALAWHASRLGIPATIVMPVNSPLVKVQNTAATDARVVLHGANYDEAVEHARILCSSGGLTYIPGFDDPEIIAGQGTAGIELLEQCPQLDCVLVPVGGGGLAAGIALAVKESNPRIRVIGIQSENVPSMPAAFRKGAPVTVAPCHTIADGIAVRRVGDLPCRLLRTLMDDLVTVDETEIANAILLLLEHEKTLVEGAGAVGVAAIHNGRIKDSGRNIAVILSGGNIDVNVLSRIIDKGLVKDGRLVKLRVVAADYPGHLARILGLVAENRGNILEINHSRAFSETQVGETAIDLIIETRGTEHIGQIQSALTAGGFTATRQLG